MGQYSQLMSKFGGYSNAYTSQVKTNYYFSVAQEGFFEVLDMFTHFFIDPLFDEEAVFKEVHAVNSEY
jgi:insulysin